MFGLKNQIKSVPINSTSPDLSGDVLLKRIIKVVVVEVFFLRVLLLDLPR